ncbi:MAG: DUF2382 domain-containing protein [Rubrobacter sp.]
MASAENRSDGFTAVEDQYSGYTVYDQSYEKIGKVDDLFVDENDSPEYIGVKMGFLGTNSTLLPFQMVRVNDERGVIEFASDKESVKNGPSFDDDREITPDFEREVHAYYGLDSASGERSGYSDYYSSQDGDGNVDLHPGARQEGQADSSGLATGATAGYIGSDRNAGRDGDRDVYDQNDDARRTSDHDTNDSEAGNVGAGMTEGDVEGGGFKGHSEEAEGVRQPGSDLDDKDELRVSRSEEELQAGTREREAGKMKVRKRVRTERQRIEVPTRHEEVSVERVPVNEEVSEAEIGDDEVSVPVVEEEVVVGKRAVKKEEIRLKKDVVEGTEVVEEDVRKEEVDIEDGTERGRGLDDTNKRRNS